MNTMALPDNAAKGHTAGLSRSGAGGGRGGFQMFRRLTASQCGSRFDHGDLEGVVPGTDAHAHAQRLPTGVRKSAAGKLDVLT